MMRRGRGHALLWTSSCSMPAISSRPSGRDYSVVVGPFLTWGTADAWGLGYGQLW